MSKRCGLCWCSMTTTIFGYCLSLQHPLGALCVVMLQAARVGSAGMWLLQGCPTGPQVLTVVPDTPEGLALSPSLGRGLGLWCHPPRGQFLYGGQGKGL